MATSLLGNSVDDQSQRRPTVLNLHIRGIVKAKKHFIAAALISASSIAWGASLAEPSQAVLSKALQKYLSQQGNLCLGKFDWPIDVTQLDFQNGTRDAVQMPVLEKLGLVASADTTVLRKQEDDEKIFPAKRYDLTDVGKKFYLAKESSATVGGQKVVHHHDFCAGKLSLKKIVRWDKPTVTGSAVLTTVTYTYNFAPAEWANDDDMKRVFPVIDRIQKGQGSAQLQQNMQLAGKSWVAVNPWE
jgi:hypothetical protein